MNINNLIATIKSRKTEEAREVARIFRLNEKKFAGALAGTSPACLSDIIGTLLEKCYAGLPHGEYLDILFRYFRDSHAEPVKEMQASYMKVTEYIFRLKRTDITEDEVLDYFLQLHRSYNRCLSISAELTAVLAREEDRRLFDIS